MYVVEQTNREQQIFSSDLSVKRDFYSQFKHFLTPSQWELIPRMRSGETLTIHPIRNDKQTIYRITCI